MITTFAPVDGKFGKALYRVTYRAELLYIFDFNDILYVPPQASFVIITSFNIIITSTFLALMLCTVGRVCRYYEEM